MRKIEEELHRLVLTKVIEPVRYSDWATPIVPVLKADVKGRICGDYKLTVNGVSHLEQYPIPTLDDLCEQMTGGKQFMKLDLNHAYSQLPLDEKSKEYVTINTHQGLFHQLGTSYNPEDHGKYLARQTSCRYTLR